MQTNSVLKNILMFTPYALIINCFISSLLISWCEKACLVAMERVTLVSVYETYCF